MTQRYRVEFAASAKAEVHDAYVYIRDRSPLNAQRWREALLAAAESLSTMPTRGRLAPESDAFSFEIRQLVCGNYRLLFTVRDDAVFILHVRHAAQRSLVEPVSDEDPDEQGTPDASH